MHSCCKRTNQCLTFAATTCNRITVNLRGTCLKTTTAILHSDRACELYVVLPDARRDLEYLLSGTLCNELRIQHDSIKQTKRYDIIKQNERTNFAHSTFILLPAHTVIMHVLNTVKIYSGKYKNKQ